MGENLGSKVGMLQRADIKQLATDIVERAAWTFGQGIVGFGAVFGLSPKTIVGGLIASLTSAAKSVLVAQFGKGTAAVFEPSSYQTAATAAPDAEQ